MNLNLTNAIQTIEEVISLILEDKLTSTDSKNITEGRNNIRIVES